MKNIKLIFLSLLVLISKSMAQTEKIYTTEELIHENSGCPENSACTKSMGEKFKKFRSYLQEYNEEVYITAQLENFRKANGLPVQFLTNEKGHKIHDAALWNSPCKQHNGIVKTYLGTQFYSDNPFKEDIWLDKVKVYGSSEAMFYQVPFKDQASYFQDNKMVVIKEFEGTFYYLAISPEGTWTVTAKSKELIMPQSEIECPKDTTYQLNTQLYQSSFCKKVWDITKKDYVVVRYPWSC